jgi:hypothetical protein
MARTALHVDVALLALGITIVVVLLAWLAARLRRRWRGHVYAPCPTNDIEHVRAAILPVAPGRLTYGKVSIEDIDRTVDPFDESISGAHQHTRVSRDVEKATGSFSKPIFGARYTVDASRMDTSRVYKKRIQEKKKTTPTRGEHFRKWNQNALRKNREQRSSAELDYDYYSNAQLCSDHISTLTFEHDRICQHNALLFMNMKSGQETTELDASYYATFAIELPRDHEEKERSANAQLQIKDDLQPSIDHQHSFPILSARASLDDEPCSMWNGHVLGEEWSAEEKEQDPLPKEMMEGLAGGDSEEESEDEGQKSLASISPWAVEFGPIPVIFSHLRDDPVTGSHASPTPRHPGIAAANTPNYVTTAALDDVPMKNPPTTRREFGPPNKPPVLNGTSTISSVSSEDGCTSIFQEVVTSPESAPISDGVGNIHPSTPISSVASSLEHSQVSEALEMLDASDSTRRNDAGDVHGCSEQRSCANCPAFFSSEHAYRYTQFTALHPTVRLIFSKRAHSTPTMPPSYLRLVRSQVRPQGRFEPTPAHRTPSVTRAAESICMQ